MDFTRVKEKAADLFSEVGFVSHINSEADYEQALELIDELFDDYDTYRPLIEILSVSIEKWENEAEEFEEFNRKVEALDDGVAVLRTLMDQYQLKAEDLKEELGGKSLVSMVLNGSRNLTRDHIQALSARFKVAPSVFFHQ
ncbi:helix-turn-helix domain-containing protein [Paraferrimonas sedimenticola]|uniref:Transcriptional regulator n=1 Tax=Paraferrimonas sedimenticola TaxID=375674 RepID=A0AA37RWZ0_9GAMM|nr:transcriptional regulator [Paraferrimonas sedimenticola]GLP96112.1 transcriptional regulator [Paraferrimonas sedimenticola]